MKKLKSTIVIAALASAASLAGTGCTAVTASGPNWNLKENSFLWDRANVTASVSTNGTTSFHEDTSTPDQQTISALTQALLQMTAVAKP